MKRTLVLSLGLAYLLLAPGVFSQEPGSDDLTATGLQAFRANEINSAAAWFEKALEQDPAKLDARAWLSDCLRRLGQVEEARQHAHRVLDAEPCHGFAHLVMADLLNPQYAGLEKPDQDQALFHYRQAVECDPRQGGAWFALWIHSLKTKDGALEKRALESLDTQEFFTPGLLAYTRWVMEGLPHGAVLVTNGDLDTYPAAMLQQVDELRTDVTVVNLSLLNLKWYAQRVGDALGFSMPDVFPGARLGARGRVVTPAHQLLQEWIQDEGLGVGGRPLTLAMTVDQSSSPDDLFRFLRLDGGHYSWHVEDPGAPIDAPSLQTALSKLDAASLAGPFVSEYDMSPVRCSGSKRLALNPMAAGLIYCQWSLEEGDLPGASTMLSWVEDFGDIAQTPKDLDERIEALRREIEKRSD